MRASQPQWQQFFKSSVPTAWRDRAADVCQTLTASTGGRKWKWREQIQVLPQLGPREGFSGPQSSMRPTMFTLLPSLRHAVKAFHVVLVESRHMKIPWRNTNELSGSYNYCVSN